MRRRCALPRASNSHVLQPAPRPRALQSTEILLRREVERRPRRDQLFLLHAVLEVADDAVRMLHHPPAHIALVDGLTLLRVLLQMGDAGETERQLRIVEMLLAL